MKLKTIIILIFTCTSQLGLSQNVDSLKIVQYKTILPYIIKGLSNSNSDTIKQREKVSKYEFVAPWEIDKFDENELNDILQKLKTSSMFEVKETSSGYSNLNLICHLQNFETEPKLNKSYSNLRIRISDYNIIDESSRNLYLENIPNAFQPKTNGMQEIILQGDQLNVFMPIEEDFSKIRGSINLSLRQIETYYYKEFLSTNKNEEFQIDGQLVELIGITGNKALFKSDVKIDGFKIISTNERNQEHSESSILSIPEFIYNKSQQLNLSQEEIDSFVNETTYEEGNSTNQPYIYIYKISGTISKLYFYKAIEIDEKGKCTVEIKYGS